MTGAALDTSYASSTISEDLDHLTSAPSPGFLDAALGYYSLLERREAEPLDDYDQVRNPPPPCWRTK